MKAVRYYLFSFVSIVAAPCMFAQGTAAVTESGNQITVRNGVETLDITACGPGVLHIVAGPDQARAASSKQPWLVKQCQAQPLNVSRSAATVTVGGPQVKIAIALDGAVLKFEDLAGHVLLQEDSRGPRSYEPEVVNGQKLYRVSDRFVPGVHEGLYGLGQHQDGMFNYRGGVVELGQTNTSVAVPLLISSKGYGILWNTASRSWFNNRFPREMKLTSDAAHALDYYFLYGPAIDTVLHHYRDLTGHAPLFAKWAYGFVQSKDRYTSAKQLLDIAGEYRSHNVPLDLIVQDWFWWKLRGDPEYSADYLKPYPNVPQALDTLHREHVHAMISVWAKFDPASNTYHEMQQHNYLILGTKDYDPTNPGARNLYWNLLVGKLFAQGWDGFWLDASEPEGNQGISDAILYGKHLFIGNGAVYTNIFPLMHTGNVYTHWRQTGSHKRVFLLTRSAFLGQQRYAAVTWSGDVYTSWWALQRQVPAGLNFALSGIPYWTTDIGGYSPTRDPSDPRYQELYTRWYEYGAFCPIFRTHGHRPSNEVFSYGKMTPILVKYDKLRYRLMPYIYSLAWRVTSDDATIMRPLVMDWRTDPKVWNIGNQFMFGPSILVNPVTVEGATSRSVYLPPAAGWYDFWTGKRLNGAQRVEAQAPIERIPLYVRAGSILPMGPEIEYANQKPDSPIELRIYPGADGSFDLYEDAGNGYEYKQGAHSLIPIHWNDQSHTVTLGQRQGQYAGMENEITFRVVLVNPGHGVGEGVSPAFDREIQYTGKQVSVSLPRGRS